MKSLTFKDTLLLRGLAIFLIVVHNYCHLLPNAIAENEYLWSMEPILQYYQYILNGGPHLILNLFSHYGFYGITIFVFLSGYGLASKYDNWVKLPIIPYLVKHATKLWRYIFIGIFIYYLAFRLFGGSQPSWDHIIKLSLFLSNLLPSRPLIFGPWWWFSLIMQFYVIFYFFYYKRSLKTIWMFTLLCLIMQYAVTYYCRNDLMNEEGLLCYFHYNFPSITLSFSLGVYVSRHNSSWIYSNYLLPISILLVLLGSFNVWIWCITSVFACIVLIQLARLLGKVIWINNILCWLGKISAWVFVVHPIVRRYIFRINDTHSVYFSLSLYLFITLAIAFIMYEVMEYINQNSKLFNSSKEQLL